MKLHIGATFRSEGWKTFDIMPGAEVDFTGDLRDLSRFGDGSIEAIYASHCVEHLPCRDIPALLQGWFRVLAPGAAVMISVPDFQLLCRLYIDPAVSAPERFQLMRIIFGGQMDAYDFHYAGWEWSSLAEVLTSAGFEKLERVRDFGLFQDSSVQAFRGVPISLNIRAFKPGGQSGMPRTAAR